MPRERAVLFIDGSNWYHGVKSLGLSSSFHYPHLAAKLAGDAEVLAIRYYIGEVRGDLGMRRNQNKFLKKIRAQGVHVIMGRIEKNRANPKKNPAQRELLKLLPKIKPRLSAEDWRQLSAITTTPFTYYTEKRVDVNIAVDMVTGAANDAYDTVYLLSADGDFIPAVNAVRTRGKTVIAASARHGHELSRAVDGFVLLSRTWFSGLRAQNFTSTSGATDKMYSLNLA